MRLLSVIFLLGSLLVLACTRTSPTILPAAVSSDNLRVVGTVSPITSLVENVGGTRIDLQGIVPEGTNSHTFEPAPWIATVLVQADLIVANGLFLEEPTLEMARANQKAGSVILTLGDRAVSQEEWVFDFSFPESDGHPNPHLWTDPYLALRYAELIRDELARLDPANAGYYHQNYEILAARTADLDRRIVQSVETIPPQNRRLLTYHDSFPFFGSRYGLEIIGALQPSDFTEPSAREVANLIDQVRDTGVPAIFGSEVFPSPIMEQIARESGAEFVDQLRDDDLPGRPGDPDHTYLGLMAANMKIMAPALGGNADAFDDFDSSLVFEGDSRAIYPQ
ncbi:MAG TPA: metal ABC transporter substrate-binding protein [Dehalococcoidia bacterium]|nr:metal ABC transporter substrate-binding protein [Dehalococcoidia bacterium]